MENEKTIKINFCDWFSSFNKENNMFINVLKKHWNVEISEHPDFLFYSCFDDKNLDYADCVKVFYTGENVLPDFNNCDYGVGPDYLKFGDRYFHRSNISPSENICNRSAVEDSFFNRRFCNFIYSNANSGEGSLLRQEFCQKLMEYKHVDCPGKVLHNMDAEDELAPRNGDWAQSKIEFLKKYKFTIAFENSCSDGYTTEKLVQPLQSFSIPIYWGNPLVTKDFNPKAFINCNDYDNDFEAVIERIKELDNDPDKYLAMLRENPMQPNFDFEQGKKFEEWLVRIVEKGNKPFNKDPLGWSKKPYKKRVLSLEKQIKDREEENEVLQTEISALKSENDKLQQKITTASKIKVTPLVKPFKKIKGNWLYKKVETERYIKTYVCGICVRKRPANVCGYIDTGLQELEQRLKKFMIESK